MLCLPVAALGLTFFSLNAAAGKSESSEAINSKIAKLKSEHVPSPADLGAMGIDPDAGGNMKEKRQDVNSSLAAQNSSMSAIIDSYIVNLQQAGYVPNANATATSKRDTLSLDSLVEKRSVPSVPLVIALLGQHGFVPANGTDEGTSSKRDVPDYDSALHKRDLPDIDLVVARLAAHGFVPTGGNISNSSGVVKRDDATGDINSVITQLEAYGFNPSDFMQGNSSTIPASVDAASVSKRDSHWSLE